MKSSALEKNNPKHQHKKSLAETADKSLEIKIVPKRECKPLNMFHTSLLKSIARSSKEDTTFPSVDRVPHRVVLSPTKE